MNVQIRDFYRSVMEDKPVFIDGAEGRKGLSNGAGVYESYP